VVGDPAGTILRQKEEGGEKGGEEGKKRLKRLKRRRRIEFLNQL